MSVIVSVYNREKHLRECLNSIINQSLTDIEIIIINDGSADRSKSIILEYASKDPRIIFIDSVNQGVSSARNKGIEKASGKYIGFVDADDYADLKMFDTLFTIAEKENASLAVCDALVLDEKLKLEKRLKLKNESVLVSDKATLVLDFLSFKYDYANWNKIYLSDIIRENKLKFDESLSIWEDLLFNLEFIACAHRIVSINEDLYYYRIHDASLMAGNKVLISEQYNLLYDRYLSFCNRNSLKLEKEAFIKDRAGTCVSTVFVLLMLRMKSNFKLFALSKQLANELRILNADIYKKGKSSERTTIKFLWLLKYKFYRLFAFLYVFNYMIKNRA